MVWELDKICFVFLDWRTNMMKKDKHVWSNKTYGMSFLENS